MPWYSITPPRSVWTFLLCPAAAKRRLMEVLPWYARPENPIDPTGAMSDDPDVYRKCLEVLEAEPSVGVVAISQDSPAHFDLAVAEATVAVARTSDKPFVFFSNISGPFRREVQNALLKEAGLPYLQGIRESLKAIKALIDYHATEGAAETLLLPPLDEQRRKRARAKSSRQAARCYWKIRRNRFSTFTAFPSCRERVVCLRAGSRRDAAGISLAIP